MITSLDSGKALDKIQHTFMFKNPTHLHVQSLKMRNTRYIYNVQKTIATSNFLGVTLTRQAKEMYDKNFKYLKMERPFLMDW